MNKLGKQIADARRAKGMTLCDTGLAARISLNMVSLIERGKRRPSPDVIVRLALALGGNADRWCGLIGRIAPDMEAKLARAAVKNAIVYRASIVINYGS